MQWSSAARVILQLEHLEVQLGVQRSAWGKLRVSAGQSHLSGVRCESGKRRWLNQEFKSCFACALNNGQSSGVNLVPPQQADWRHFELASVPGLLSRLLPRPSWCWRGWGGAQCFLLSRVWSVKLKGNFVFGVACQAANAILFLGCVAQRGRSPCRMEKMIWRWTFRS